MVNNIFLGKDFISINKSNEISWEEIKHIVISLINDFYSSGKDFVIEKGLKIEKKELEEIEKKIVNSRTKIRPAVAKDGGDIKFKEYNNGIVKVQLQGSCSGCPSSTMTLKQEGSKSLVSLYSKVKKLTQFNRYMKKNFLGQNIKFLNYFDKKESVL